MLNMMQGIYVFFIFVCKRDVANIVLGKERTKRISDMASKSMRVARGATSAGGKGKKRGPSGGGGRAGSTLSGDGSEAPDEVSMSEMRPSGRVSTQLTSADFRSSEME